MVAFASANAQEFPKYTFEIGAGYTTPVGSVGPFLNEGWNLRAGVGGNFNAHLGAMVNVGYDSIGVNNATLGNIGFGNGHVDVFHATVDPVVHLTPRSHLDFYLTGGGGLFHMYETFGSPETISSASTSYATGNVPLLGFYPGNYGGSQTLSNYSVNKPGFDVGGGVAIGAFGHGKFFAEARWDHMFMNNGAHLDFLPVSFGFRW
jgi:hypothetical protein